MSARSGGGDETVRRVALVTGSSRGMGRATALLLARRGYDVAVHYRREEEAARAVAKEIESLGREAIIVAGDLSDPETPSRLVGAVGDRFGALDVLVANAASTVFRPLMEVEARHIDLTFRTVVGSFVLLTQAAVPLMSGRDGTIVAVSGIDSLRVMENHGVLGPAKAALETLVRYLTHELAPHDIAAVAVLPGFVDTDSARLWADRSLPGGAEEMDRDVPPRTPAGRLAEPGEMAEIIAFLCTPAGRWLRGQELVADGGVTLHWH